MNVEDTLKRRGFASQESLAEYLVHRTFVGHLETGQKDFQITTIIQTAGALGVSLSEMFEGTDTGQPSKSKRAGKATAQANSRCLRSLPCWGIASNV